MVQLDARRVASGVLFNIVGTAAVTAAGFLLTPFLIHGLGRARYGSSVLIGSTLAYSSLLDFGVGLAVMKLVAALSHLEDRTEVNRVISAGVALYSAVGVLVFLVGSAALPVLPGAFGLHGRDALDFQHAFLLMLITLALTFPSAVLTATLQGFHQYRLLNGLLITASLVAAGLSVIAVEMGMGLFGVALANAVAQVGLFLAKLRAARARLGVRIAPRLVRRSVVREIGAVSAWVFVMNLAVRIILDTDTIVVGSMLGAAAVAGYQVALGPATAVRRVGDQFNSVSLTTASSLHAQERRESLRPLLLEATRMVATLLVPCIAVFAAVGRPLLRTWVGQQFLPSYSTLVVLTAAVLAIAVQGTAGQILLALGLQRRMAKYAMVEAVANLALSISLARPLGLVGVALGTLLPTLVTAFGVYLPIACRLVGLTFREVGRALVAPLLASAIGGVGLFAFAHAVSLTNLLAVLAAAGVTICAAVLVCMLGDPGRRAMYLGHLPVLGSRRAVVAHD